MLKKLDKRHIRSVLTVIEMTCFHRKACVFSLACYLVIVNLSLLLSQAWFYDHKFVPGCPDNKIVVMVDTMAKQMKDCVIYRLSAFPCRTQVSLMTLIAHSNHQCHPFVCFVVVDVMLSSI